MPAQVPGLAPERNERRARRRKSIAVVLGFVLVVFVLATWQNLDAGGQVAVAVGTTIVAGALFVLHQNAVRELSESGDELLARDRRPPIVYLRSFDSDDTPSNVEVALAEIMEEAGPFVAIGRPGDELPPLGAARFYVADDEWQPFVADLLDRAALVILLAGETEGLVWELNQCARRLRPERLTVLIPSDRAAYDSFATAAQRAGIPVRLPPYPEAELARYRAGAVSGLIHFDRSWTGRIEYFPRGTLQGSAGYQIATANTRAAERLRGAVQPVAAAAGLTIAGPRVNKLAAGIWVYLGLMAIFVLVLAGLVLGGVLE